MVNCCGYSVEVYRLRPHPGARRIAVDVGKAVRDEPVEDRVDGIRCDVEIPEHQSLSADEQLSEPARALVVEPLGEILRAGGLGGYLVWLPGTSHLYGVVHLVLPFETS